MSNELSFTNWLNENMSFLDLKISNLSWSQEWGTNLFDIEASIKINNMEYVGRATDKDKFKAILKAASESLERTFAANYETSSGIAVHVDSQIAFENAKNELVEHHLFLQHFHTNTPFIKINMTTDLGLNKNSKSQDILNKTDFFKTSKILNLETVVAKIKFGNGFVIGLGTDQNFEFSIKKAFFEALRKYSHYEIAKEEPISIKEFLLLKEKSFFDHGRLALDKEYATLTSSLFPEQIDYCRNDIIFPQNLIVEVNALCWSNEFFQRKPPLFAYRASSDGVYKLYVGDPNNRNESVFENFKIKLPHPLC